jgi:hypothetical protein
VAAARLAVSPTVVRRLIDQRILTSRTIPGAWTKVRTADVDRLAEASTRPAVESTPS